MKGHKGELPWPISEDAAVSGQQFHRVGVFSDARHFCDRISSAFETPGFDTFHPDKEGDVESEGGQKSIQRPAPLQVVGHVHDVEGEEDDQREHAQTMEPKPNLVGKIQKSSPEASANARP